jgi:adenine phosphoribosyltransferase
MELENMIRDVSDFPSPGIIFKDITPLLSDPAAFNHVQKQLADRYSDMKIDKVVGIESRGFIFAPPLALDLEAGFIPARKPGKLPWKTIEESYSLEYGTNTICMHTDAITPGERVLVIDDLLATGGTMAATCSLIENLGGVIVEICTIIELGFLEGRKLIESWPFHTLIKY